jgi:hypothetical protein
MDEKKLLTLFKLYNIINEKELINIILKHKPNRYLAKGTHSICFIRDSDKIVIKCVIKAKETIIKTKEIFKNEINKLVNIFNKTSETENLILEPIDIEETTNYIVYTQPYCVDISDDNVNPLITKQILEMLSLMFDNNIKLADIYYKNFGIYKNKLCYYDYHNVEDFDIKKSTCNFLISNLYTIFSRLSYCFLKWSNNISNNIKFTTANIIKDNHGKDKFPNEFYKLLINLYENNIERAKYYNNKCINYLTDICSSFELSSFELNSNELLNRLQEIINYINPLSIDFNLNINIFSLIKNNYDIIFKMNKKYKYYYIISNISTSTTTNYECLITYGDSNSNLNSNSNSNLNLKYIIKYYMFDINNEIKIKDYLNDKLIRLDIIRLDNCIILLQTTFN